MSHALDALTFLLCLAVILSACLCRGEAVIPYQAAAPDLYAALDRLVEWFAKLEGVPPLKYMEYAAVAALAKARGEE